MTGRAQDDAFHEIQLNGKQLVFLFMAATVVSVVIFLCGVLVGRGVQSARAEAEQTLAASEGPTASAPQRASSGSGAASDPVVAPGSDPRTAAAPPEVDDLTFFSRLEESTPPVEDLKPKPPSAPATAPRSAPVPAARPTAPAAAPRDAAAVTKAPPAPVAAPRPGPSPAAVQSAPAGDWAVQIAALNVLGEAEAIARRMASKGYAAYVVTPGNGTPAVYRVRIGPFKTKREADTVAVKLEKEEQFKPWVTR